jgi:hypothetical protein
MIKKGTGMKNHTMQKQNKTEGLISKKNKHGDIMSITIDGMKYDLFDDNAVSIPRMVLEKLRLSDFPSSIEVMIEDEYGGVFADTEGIHPTYVTVIGNRQTSVSVEVNIFRQKWNSVIEYSVYRDTLFKLLEFPEQAGISNRNYLHADDDVLNYSFEFILEGETFGEIFAIARRRIQNTLKPLNDIEEMAKKELGKIWNPFS